MTIDEGLELLTKAKETIGGEKILILCLVNSGISDCDIEGMNIVNDGNSQYVEVHTRHPELDIDN